MKDQDKLSLNRALDIMTEAREIARKELVGYIDLSKTNNVEGIAVMFVNTTMTMHHHVTRLVFKFTLNSKDYEIQVDLSKIDTRRLVKNREYKELGEILYKEFSERLAVELLKAVEGDLNIIIENI